MRLLTTLQHTYIFLRSTFEWSPTASIYKATAFAITVAIYEESIATCSVVILTPGQKVTLRKQAEGFSNWLKTENGRKKVTGHRDHERYFKTA